MVDPTKVKKDKKGEETTEGKTEVKKEGKKVGALALSDQHVKILVAAGIPLTILLAFVVQYVHQNFIVLPRLESTPLGVLRPPVVDQKRWCPLDATSLFSLSAQHADAPKFDLLAQDGLANWDEGDGVAFGKRVVRIGQDSMTIRWLGSGESWSSKIAVTQYNKTGTFEFSAVFSGTKVSARTSDKADNGLSLTGESKMYGKFDLAIAGEGMSTGEDATVKVATELSTGKALLTFAVQGDTDIEISFSTAFSPAQTGTDFEDDYAAASKDWEDTIEKAFALGKNGMPVFYQSMGRSAAANLLAGNRFVSSQVPAKGNINKKFLYPFEALLSLSHPTDTSSYPSVYPLFMKSKFRLETIAQIFTYGFNTVNENVRVPFLSGESLDFTRLPPPSALLALEAMLTEGRLDGANGAWLEPLYPRIVAYINEYEASVGDAWEEVDELAPGYERTVKGDKAKHLDLFCELHVLTRLGVSLCARFGSPSEQAGMAESHARYAYSQLVATHWHEDGKRFADTDGDSFDASPSGYYHILPYLYDLMPLDSPQAEHVIAIIEQLSSPVGIRSSVDESSPVYLPANYLIMRGLKRLSGQSGALQSRAHAVYSRIRNTLIAFVARTFKSSGAFWQGYDPVSGAGVGERQHYSASLILLIMSEQF